MNRRLVLVVMLGLALATHAADEPLPAHLVCRNLLEPAGFDNRFEALRVLVVAVGCNLRELLTDEAMRAEVAPRVRVYAANCFDDQERLYLQQSLRNGALREAPGATLERCSDALDTLRGMPLP